MPAPLPLELYHTIISHVDNSTDLCSLASSCSVFLDRAQRCLFGDVKPASLRQQNQFLSSINSEPHRFGPWVHSFYVDSWNSQGSDRANALSNALSAMCNLKHLKLQWWRPSMILHGCTFQLRTLSCAYYLRKEDILFMLSDFLPSQRGIKSLVFKTHGGPVDTSTVPLGLCPQLESLGIETTSLASVFVSDDRFITHFQWLQQGTPPPMTAYQLNRLTSLALSINVVDIDTSFGVHLTSLLHLELRLLEADFPTLLERIHFLKNIPRLETLTLACRQWDSDLDDDEDSSYQSALLRRAFEFCPYLSYIDFSHDSMPEKATRLTRWTSAKDDSLVWTRQSADSAAVAEWRYLE